ncbi:putative Ig domain-containing protein [Stappia indica]|uniref:putative Ig domain-containing protein n=1 Tax=Stappia indica TaxID=538381 RepID=UPI003CC8318F
MRHADHGGDRNFTVTATDANSDTGNAAYSIQVDAPVVISLNPAAGSLANGEVGAAYSQSFTASGGTSPYTYAVTAGALPDGLTLASNGALTGTPTTLETANFTVTATDANSDTGNAAYSIQVDAPVVISLNPAAGSLANGEVGAAYSQSFTASGGTSPYTYAVTAGALPDGLTLASNGALTGTPTTLETANFTVTATDANNHTGNAAYSIQVDAPVVITLSPAAGSLANGEVGAAYSQSFTASGGTSPYSYAVTAGALPDGLTLAANGALSGTPTTAETANFTVTATDANNHTGNAAYSIQVDAPVVISLNPAAGSLANGEVGTAYSQSFTASGGTSPYTYAVTAGALPDGLTLASNGALTGTPTTLETANFTVTATDANSDTGNAAYSIQVDAPVVISLNPAAGSLANGEVGAAYSQSFTASGGTSPYTYAVTAGALPDGLTLASNGALTGTPTTLETANFTVTATDANNHTGNAAYSIQVDAPVVITLSPAAGSLANGEVGAAYSQSFTASGGTSPYSYAVTAGALPDGLTLAANGALSGTPTTAETANFTVTATDANSDTGNAAYSIQVEAAPVTITLSPAAGSLANGEVGAAYSQSFTASGGTSPYSYAVTAGALPDGLTLASNGALTGTPTTLETANFTVTATDANSDTGNAAYSIQVDAPVVISLNPAAGSLANGEVGAAYSQSFTASGGTSPYTYAVTAGALPDGLTLASNGALTGTPTTLETANFTVTATDANNHTGNAAYSIQVDAPVVITLSPAAGSLANGEVGTAYSQSFTASGGTSPYTYAVTAGALPDGLTLAGDGTLSGTPTTAETANFTVTATDANSDTGNAAYSIQVDAPVVISLNPAAGSLANGEVGAAYSQSFTASGGTSPYTYAVTAGALPDGLTLASNGALTGTPTTLETANFTVTATDANSDTGNAAYSIQVDAPVVISLSPAAGSLANGEVGAAYSQSFTASGGTSPYTYAVTAGALPDGLTLASNGALTGTPTTLETANFTVTATDANNHTGNAAYSIQVDAPVVISLNPAAGSLANGEVGAAYSQSFTASGGTSPYTYAVTAGALPDGLTLASNGALTGTPTTVETANFTVTATDANSDTGNAAYSIQVDAAPVVIALSPAAGSLANGEVGAAYSQSFTASGGTSPYTYAVTAGALPDGLTLAANGALSGTPTTAETANFTITATDANSATGNAAYSIQVDAPVVITLSPAAGSLANGEVGAAYSQSFTASGGTSPYSYAVTAGALPDGLTLAGDGTLSGTPTTVETANFTVTATDANSDTGNAVYSLQVDAAPVVIALSPAGGELPAATAGEDYTASITASGGLAPYIYSVTSGSLPDGLVLNISTGQLNGPLDPDTEGNYSFTIQARDANNVTGSAAYTLSVAEQTVTVSDKDVTVPPGSTPPNVNLASGATGGPFQSANIVAVEPANAGTAQIVFGEFAQLDSAPAPVGFYLKFTPNPTYSGQVRVRFTLTSSLGTSNVGTVLYTLGYDPQAVAKEVHGLVHDFVQARQNLLSNTIKVPGLRERRQMESARDVINMRMMPSAQGVTLGFATSLAQMSAASEAIERSLGVDTSSFNVWVDGTFAMHNRNGEDSRWGTFALFSAGADYLLTERALIGISFHFDRMSDPTRDDATLTGNGWFVGPYASFELGRGVFWDTSLLYGGSSNDIDSRFWDGSFDTSRWMFSTSLSGVWHLDEATTLAPKLRTVYLSEKIDDYSVRNAAGNVVGMDGFTVEQLRVSLGAELARQFVLEEGMIVTPSIAVTGGFAGLGGSGAFGSLGAGVELTNGGMWSLDGALLFNIEGDGQASAGGRMGLAVRF